MGCRSRATVFPSELLTARCRGGGGGMVCRSRAAVFPLVLPASISVRCVGPQCGTYLPENCHTFVSLPHMLHCPTAFPVQGSGEHAGSGSREPGHRISTGGCGGEV